MTGDASVPAGGTSRFPQTPSTGPLARTGRSAADLMAVAAARRLHNGTVCFVGIGIPSRAANLARRTHAPDCVLIYESGTIGAKPEHLPLSIGDGELAETADAVVSVPEIFAYWLQPGRVDVGFLGAAQIDRYANLNSTVIGDYDRPRVRLPGGGGAPEIAALCGEVIVVLEQSPRTFVERLDFRSTAGFGDGPGFRERLGYGGGGMTAVVTDLGVLEPDPDTCELVQTQLHPGVTADDARAATGWPLRVAADVATTEPPTARELAALRSLKTTTEEGAAHGA
jgi:glutaconate CoA-transferase, subunit B